jgi:hypothetical protein
MAENDNGYRIATGDYLFALLRSTKLLEQLIAEMRFQLSGRAVAEYLRTTAGVVDDEDEAIVLRDAAAIVEEGWSRV